MKNVSKETIIRTIILIVALVNQGLTTAGKNPLPFAEEQIYAIITLIATTGAAIWAWWKNNSFTSAALEADKVKEKIKNGDLKDIPISEGYEMEGK